MPFHIRSLPVNFPKLPRLEISGFRNRNFNFFIRLAQKWSNFKYFYALLLYAKTEIGIVSQMHRWAALLNKSIYQFLVFFHFKFGKRHISLILIDFHRARAKFHLAALSQAL